ncbi:hypothetical protein OBBRIDRAFT_860488 [Obba rivulosa]|uniref:Uncharacterized protein n=1 Tax=Obba rivulosa TaxID=1052685 RepID=A0A8E2ATR2_9APHY|nr:hypothetical protein OBBRIDRAFT_860488 [Obba rivulosa]
MSTVPRELDMFWQRKINSAMLLFHLNRWTVLSWVILNIITNFLPPASLSVRREPTSPFSATRTYAISGGHWPLALVVFSLGLVPVATNAVRALLVPPTFSDRFSHVERVLVEVSTRVCVIASDTIVLGVTWFKTFKMKREADRHGVHAPLTTLLLRDGVLYLIHSCFDNLSNGHDPGTMYFMCVAAYADACIHAWSLRAVLIN